MRRRSDRTIVINNQAAVIVVAASGTVEYEWKASETVTAGQYEGEVEVTFSGGLIETFPNDRYIVIDIIGEVA